MIVIPMAGLSRRFHDAGYEQPKFMLDLNGRSLFAHAVDSFRAYFTKEPFLFIGRDEPGVTEFIAREVAALGMTSVRVVPLPRPTLGQAETVKLGLLWAEVEGATPLTIFNIDTFRPGFQYPDAPWMRHADGYIEVMTASDPGFSYVLPVDGDTEGRVAETAEKTVISDLASTGLYWFRRAGDFMDIMANDGAAARAHGELYVAPLYNALIARRLDIRFHRVSAEEVTFCGTPAQYHALIDTARDRSRPFPAGLAALDGDHSGFRTQD